MNPWITYAAEAAGRRFESHQLALLNLAALPHITKDRPLGSFAEKDGAIVGGTMQDVDDDHLSTYNAVKDQVVAVNTSANIIVFKAGDDGEAIRTLDETVTTTPEFLEE
jgi:hypothetical protein